MEAFGGHFGEFLIAGVVDDVEDFVLVFGVEPDGGAKLGVFELLLVGGKVPQYIFFHFY